jgi:hypothetical protein
MTPSAALVTAGESHAGRSRPSRVRLALHTTAAVRKPIHNISPGTTATANPFGIRFVASPRNPQWVGIPSGRCGQAHAEASMASASSSGGSSQSRRMRRASRPRAAAPVTSNGMKRNLAGR